MAIVKLNVVGKKIEVDIDSNESAFLDKSSRLVAKEGAVIKSESLYNYASAYMEYAYEILDAGAEGIARVGQDAYSELEAESVVWKGIQDKVSAALSIPSGDEATLRDLKENGLSSLS